MLNHAAAAAAAKLAIELAIPKNTAEIRLALVRAHATTTPAQATAAAGMLGGAVRRHRSAVRLKLAAALINLLKIEATQTVARHVMMRAFQEAASHGALCAHFATPGRDATLKYTDAADKKMSENSEIVTDFGTVYSAYNERLKTKIAAMKAAL